MAELILLPCRSGTFVSSNMNEFSWENFHDFCKHIAGKLYSLRVTNIQHIGPYAALIGLYFMLAFWCATEFRVCGKCGHDVSWHIDFRNDLNMQIACVFNNFTAIFLCVEKGTIRFAQPIISFFHVIHSAIACHGADRGKPRIFLYLESPSLVFCQMPVEIIHFVHGHSVQNMLDLIYSKEMSTTVEHESAIPESWFVVYFKARNGGSFICLKCRYNRLCLVWVKTCHDVGRHNLLYGLESIEESTCCRCTNLNLFLCDAQFVPFVRQIGVNVHFNVSFLFACYSCFATCCFQNCLDKLFSFNADTVGQMFGVDTI